MKSLYLCYFGISQPLVQTQVLPYLRMLARGDSNNPQAIPVTVRLLTFESSVSQADVSRFEEIRSALAAEGIEWAYLKYHKRPSVPATLYDVLMGALFVRKLIMTEGIDVLHARVHVPCLMATLGRRLAFGRKPKILFDVRGFFPEEYVDAGLWKKDGLLFKAVKRIEDWLFSESDAFVVLTEKAERIVSSKTGDKPIEVIPCCVDLNRFLTVKEEDVEETRKSIGNVGRFTAVYIGSFGGWYLTDETIEAFKQLRGSRPDAFALILTQSDIEDIKTRLESVGFTPADYLVTRVAPSEVSRFLTASDIAFSFIKPSYSKIASSPTKNAEYLASGLPILSNDGIGDTTEQLTEDRTGVIVTELSEEGIRNGIGEILELIATDADLRDRCRESADRRFSLERIGGPSYRRIYSRASNGGRAR